MKVKISYLFSRNKKVGSKVIAWASGLLIQDLEKIPSHMAVLVEYEDFDAPFVIESVLESGVRLVPYKKWKEINEECYKISSKKTIEFTEIAKITDEYWGKKYDWGGILYFGWRFLLHFLFKLPFPKENAWQSDSRYFCNELAGEIAGYHKYNMVTPAKMCSDFLKM